MRHDFTTYADIGAVAIASGGLVIHISNCHGDGRIKVTVSDQKPPEKFMAYFVCSFEVVGGVPVFLLPYDCETDTKNAVFEFPPGSYAVFADGAGSVWMHKRE